MIISQTPYRVSFAGGGTDLPAFYRQEFGAAEHDDSISITYVYHPQAVRELDLDRLLQDRAGRDRSTTSSTTSVREAMNWSRSTSSRLEITTVGDVPAARPWMGPAAARRGGLLNALYAYRGQVVSRDTSAGLRQACKIEIDILKKPIGRQDQYAAAFGGLQPFPVQRRRQRRRVGPRQPETLEELERRTLLLYTGQTRDADEILEKQIERDARQDERAPGHARPRRREMRKAIAGPGDLDAFAELLPPGLGAEDSRSDSGHQRARGSTSGPRPLKPQRATGGKLLGAGGGGFLLVMAPPWRHRAIREALGRPRELPFKIARHGSRNIFIQQ